MLGTTLRKRYQIIKALAKGGFGETYLAQDLDLPNHPYCVVKRLSPYSKEPECLQIARRLFNTEAQTLSQLGNHDRIPRLFAYFEENQEFYLVQEYIPGNSLQEELLPGKRFNTVQVANLLLEILSILEFVHDAGVIHRDLKPANLIRREIDWKLVLIDFGAVKQISTQTINSQGEVSLTIAVGTPGYMPSEQMSGQPHFSSDLYAVGRIGIQALTGILPQQLPANQETGESIWRNRLISQQQEDIELLEIIDCMVRYDFRDRYQSAREVLQALANFSGDFSSLSSEAKTVNPSLVPTAEITRQTQRALAAIVFTDSVGFSAKMSVNEEDTVNLIRRDLQLMRTSCQQFSGSVIKSTGDGLLMYFSSAVNAVNCAIEIQRSLANNQTTLINQDSLLHRIGIHLGDVLIEADDVMGNGVNIAARLEPLSPPGGICLSQAVYEVVKSQIKLPITYVGERQLKNILEPVGVYQILVQEPAETQIQSNVKVSPQHSSRFYRDRQILLNKVKNYWIKGVLESSLHGRALIELGLENRGDLVEHPWGMVWLNQSELSQSLPTEVKISDLFQEMGTGRSLLILGEPGGGKTTTLLEICRQFLEQAFVDLNALIPVIFNLSSWTKSNRNFADWLVGELNSKYQVSAEISRNWLEDRQILLFLDGLDEVRDRYREDCVAAINKFQQDCGTTEMVICCRRKEYETLNNRLNLQAAICLQPLNFAQIQQYLANAGEQLTGVKTALAEDKILQELVQSPLILTLIVLAYQGISASKLPNNQSIALRRAHLFDTYIERMLSRRRVTETYPQAKAKHWLIQLAKQLKKQSQTIFLIERMQPDLWLSPWQKIIYAIALLSSFFAGGFFVGNLVLSSDRLLIVLIFSSLLFVAIFGIYRLNSVETISWSWQKAYTHLRLGIIIGTLSLFLLKFPYELIFNPLHWQIFQPENFPFYSFFRGAVFGFSMGIIYGLTRGLTGAVIEKNTFPNQGIWLSAKNALIFGLIGGIVLGIAAYIIGWLPLFWGIFGFSFGLFIGGGVAVIKHLLLRIILYFSGVIPWNYRHFLDYATERIFLQKVGGGYIFIHRLLLEHLAKNDW
ncbi:MAG: protein kinase [Oscillatoria sp. PMC 1051.18]|nr:protein kinase [Oscillatoria sp. PMC 1050.18]MEC5028848.1 protein kinase [Oscillatoria sp. PMC 1051.18]